ncbi:MAG: hypothetical protein AB1758_05175 [Candidatus Eremiobacterota bacterium]
MKRVALLLLALFTVACSTERRDVHAYFQAVDPYIRKLVEFQVRLTDVSAQPREQRQAGYEAIAKEAEGVRAKLDAIQPPVAAQNYHKLLSALISDFGSFASLTARRVDQSQPDAERQKAKAEVEKLQASWPSRLEALKLEQDLLGSRFGIRFD